MFLSAGQTSDYIGARALLHSIPKATVLLGDRGYDADWFRNALIEMGISPCIPLTRWRGRIGEQGVEWLLTQTIRAGQKSGALDEDSVKRVAVDTTVMEKNIAYPTDSRLYERAREQLAALAQEAGVELRQSYARLAPRLAQQVGRYAHAKQFKRMRKALKKLKGYTGRVMRDLRRHLQDIPASNLRDRIITKLALVSQLLHQAPKGADKIYALHETQVDCISKGKARVRYEFGCKVSVATTLDEGFVVGMRSFPGNPYDGHTLKEALEQVEILTDQRPDLAVVDRGYRGHGEEKTRVLISGTRRGLTPKLIVDLRRRSAIEVSRRCGSCGGTWPATFWRE
jgi:transposase, IS5 family